MEKSYVYGIKYGNVREGAVYYMTQIRAKTMEMIENLPDEKMIYVFNILKNMEAFSKERGSWNTDSADKAFSILMKYSRSLPEDFDYKEELVAAREEKYGLTAKNGSGRGGSIELFTVSDKL